jgi:hypothetical protein
MAAQGIVIAESGGAVATLNWNDSTKTATTITVDNTKGAQPVTFTMVVSGTSHSTTVQPGNISTLAFPTALAVIVNQIANKPGVTGLTFSGLQAYGMGTG